MKTTFLLASALVLYRIPTLGQIIYQSDFSGGKGGVYLGTVGGDTTFAHSWTVTSSLQSTGGNQYDQYNINIPTLPSNPNARWYGGYYNLMSSNTNLPAQWQLSFDISLPSAQPIRIQFELSPTNSFGPSTIMTFWAQVTDPGWQSITIDQNTPYSLQTVPFGQGGWFLDVTMASHDTNGNPLTISQIGSYNFLLDNILLEAVPEPSVLALSAGASFLFVVGLGVVRRREKTLMRREA